MTRRQGFTIVELMVALAVSTVALVIVWQLYRAEHRRFDVDQNRLAALQSGVLLDEYLAQDLDRIAVEFTGQPGEPFTQQMPLKVVDSGRGLELRVFAAEKLAGMRVAVEPVTYKQDPSTGEITRSAPSGNTRFPGLVVEHLQFSLLSTPLVLPAPTAPGDKTISRDYPIWYVKYVLACISPEVRARPPEQRPAEARVTLVGSIPLVLASQRRHHLYWRPAYVEVLEHP